MSNYLFPLALGLALIAGGIAFINIGTNSSAVEVSFTKIAEGEQSDVTERVNYLITTQDELNELWKLIRLAEAPPEVDFSTNSVIAVFAGESPTAGYGIEISKITDKETRDVSITLTKPGPDCITAQVITAPFQLAVVPATTMPFSHQDVIVIDSCKS